METHDDRDSGWWRKVCRCIPRCRWPCYRDPAGGNVRRTDPWAPWWPRCWSPLLYPSPPLQASLLPSCFLRAVYKSTKPHRTRKKQQQQQLFYEKNHDFPIVFFIEDVLRVVSNGVSSQIEQLSLPVSLRSNLSSRIVIFFFTKNQNSSERYSKVNTIMSVETIVAYFSR